MRKEEKIKVYFKMNGRHYKLFNVIQMGKDGLIDLKITDYFNNLILLNKLNGIKGYLSEEEIGKSRFVYKSEISYHADGSFLHKITENSKPEYLNPYGQGKRWTPTASIYDFQPIMNIAIRRMEIYNKSSLYPKLKSNETAYVCKNDDLFEEQGTYLLILYIRNKKLPLNCYTTVKLYSDIITELNEELDLCIFIQRHHYPAAQPYYSERFKGMITPYQTNSINFCNKDSSKDEMRDKFDNTIFSPKLNRFLLYMTDGKFINLSEDKLQLIDQVDILFQGKEGETSPISKPDFIKQALNFLGNNLSSFNKQSSTIKQGFMKQWITELEREMKNREKQ